MLLTGNLNFKLRIVFWNIFFFEIWRSEKRMALSKKSHLYIFLHCYQQLLTLHISSRCKAPLYWEPPSIWHHYHHRQQHTVAGWIVGIHCHTTVVLFGNSFLSWRLVLDFNESQEPHRSIIQWRWVYLNKIFWSNRHSREFSIYEPSSLDDKSSFNQEIALLPLRTAEVVIA